MADLTPGPTSGDNVPVVPEETPSPRTGMVHIVSQPGRENPEQIVTGAPLDGDVASYIHVGSEGNVSTAPSIIFGF